MRPFRPVWIGLGVLILCEGVSRAGMPAYTLADVPRVRSLADVARMRLEVISFFGIMFLLFAAMIQALWNGLRKDFPRLPRLSYFRALSLIALWGLLFLLVLTMISGARELMTPGAWEKVGATYRLAPEPPPIEAEITERYEALERLRTAIWDKRSTEAFPPRESIDESLWTVPRSKGAKYVYLGGARYPDDSEHFFGPSTLPQLLVVEPESMGRDRLAIFRTGDIRWVAEGEIETLSKPEKR